LNLLLDTHILLWWMADDALLTKKARQMIADVDNTIFVSAVNIWEIQLKRSLGKLRISDDFLVQFAKESFESLPLTHVHASAVVDLPWCHRDPFDRILVAQAKAESLRFLTSDLQIASYGPFVELA
jgi:PIN domain nuclease of toxin-antitoxin system